MTELDEFDQTLNAELDRLQKEIDGLARKDYNQKKNSIKKCQGQVKSIATLLESYELEISNLDRTQAQKYVESLKSINQRYGKLKNELEYKRNEEMNQENLFKDRQQQVPTDPTQMTSQQMIDLGDQTQDKSMKALDNILTTVNAGNELADKINAELDKQIEQLDRMYNTVKDTQSQLKRTKKFINYFARQLYTDKLLMGFLGVIAIGILVLIIVSIVKKK